MPLWLIYGGIGWAAGLLTFAVLVLAAGKFAGTRNYLPTTYLSEDERAHDPHCDCGQCAVRMLRAQ